MVILLVWMPHWVENHHRAKVNIIYYPKCFLWVKLLSVVCKPQITSTWRKSFFPLEPKSWNSISDLIKTQQSYKLLFKIVLYRIRSQSKGNKWHFKVVWFESRAFFSFLCLQLERNVLGKHERSRPATVPQYSPYPPAGLGCCATAALLVLCIII